MYVTDMGAGKSAHKFKIQTWSNRTGSVRRADYILFATPNTSTTIKSLHAEANVTWWQASADIGARPALYG